MGRTDWLDYLGRPLRESDIINPATGQRGYPNWITRLAFERSRRATIARWPSEAMKERPKEYALPIPADIQAQLDRDDRDGVFR